ncbi:MAG: ureidoglycolate lyase [Candidatus Latescibacterota bacterium]
MKTVKIEELSLEAFRPFGCYAHHIDPQAEKIGAPPVEFYRDMLQQDLGGFSIASFSTCRVAERERVIDVTEYHSKTAEGILPLDDDILIHVGPATANDQGVPIEKMRVFRVPRGTMVVLRPGVWHHAPFVVNEPVANVLIVLPERAYATDCTVVELAGEDQIRIA